MPTENAKANRGSPGIDSLNFDTIEKKIGMENFLGSVAKELQEKRYKPQSIKRTRIPKANGKMRPLGIPTIKDRVIQTAAVLVLERIFEADLPDEQYAIEKERMDKRQY